MSDYRVVLWNANLEPESLTVAALLTVITPDLISDYVAGRLVGDDVEAMMLAIEKSEDVFQAVMAARRADVRIEHIRSADRQRADRHTDDVTPPTGDEK